jgi:hypothetical protein
MLYTEQLYEFNDRPVYSESGAPALPASTNSIYNGRFTAASSSVFNWANYNSNFNYQNEVYKAINYCAYKNRVTSSNSNLGNEVKWYLPAQAQLLGMWLSYNSYKDIATSNYPPNEIFWSSTENADYNFSDAQYVNFLHGNVGHYFKTVQNWARCVRDDDNSSSSSSMIQIISSSYPVIDFEKGGMSTASWTTTPKGDGTGYDDDDNNMTLYKTLRVAMGDALGGVTGWDPSLCNQYIAEGTINWRLPTQRELQAIWILQSEIKRALPTFNLLADNYYWSATTANTNKEGGVGQKAGSNIWTIYGSRIEAGSSGNMPNQAKTEQLRVRCVSEVAAP